MALMATVAWVPLHQLFALLHCRLAVLCGALLSMLMFSTVVLAVLSALSVALPLALWFAPSSVMTASPAHSCLPDSASPQVKRTRTALLNQPAALALRSVPSSLTVLP